MPDVLERRTALCRGCEAQLTETANGLWVDQESDPACIKGESGWNRPPVPHMPMPGNLRGAPK